MTDVTERRKAAATVIVRMAWPALWRQRTEHLRATDSEARWQAQAAAHRQVDDLLAACLTDRVNRSALANRAHREGVTNGGRLSLRDAIVELTLTDEFDQ